MEVIQTDRLRVRTINNQDHERFFLLQGDPSVMRFIRPIKTRAESDAALNEMLAAGEPEEGGRWMVEDKETGRFVGTLAIIPVPYDTTKIQLGYALVPAEWGKGYATEATRELIRVLNTQPGIFRIGSFVDAENLASARVLIKAGFVEEAILQNWFRFPNQGNVPKDCVLFKIPDLGKARFLDEQNFDIQGKLKNKILREQIW